MARFDRREIVREFPRPTSDAAFTPNLDSYLPSMISDAKVTDNNLRETQDNEAVWQEVLENTGYDPAHSGPLCTMYENHNLIHESQSEGNITLDNSFVTSPHQFQPKQ